ncbi:MAG: IS256 family transposase, partial [Nitrospirae bacterium]|nr:IS256 family transposase [Nitrospirota bacterium]
PLSAASIQRLKARWELEYAKWKEEDLSDFEPVYMWADGIYVKAGLGKDKAALLVIIVAMSDGSKKVIAVESGYRESKESWAKVLRLIKERGLRFPRLLVADGHLGIWSALSDVYPEVEEQRCWNHKITNVLDQFPKRLRSEAAELLCEMPYAPTKAECETMKAQFTKRFVNDYQKAVETLDRDWERMVTFYMFPKEHWTHIRTTNVVESPFSTVRLRTDAARRMRKVANATALIWKVLLVVEKRFRKLNAPHILRDVYEGVKFVDGEKVSEEKAA